MNSTCFEMAITSDFRQFSIEPVNSGEREDPFRVSIQGTTISEDNCFLVKKKKRDGNDKKMND
uniref:Uncharacterized protein n=1 Tax=Onchocerca volvulus TaxID=6282 RepID=A0A8R1Y042_ONCVO